MRLRWERHRVPHLAPLELDVAAAAPPSPDAAAPPSPPPSSSSLVRRWTWRRMLRRRVLRRLRLRRCFLCPLPGPDHAGTDVCVFLLNKRAEQLSYGCQGASVLLNPLLHKPADLRISFCSQTSTCRLSNAVFWDQSKQTIERVVILVSHFLNFCMLVRRIARNQGSRIRSSLYIFSGHQEHREEEVVFRQMLEQKFEIFPQSRQRQPGDSIAAVDAYLHAARLSGAVPHPVRAAVPDPVRAVVSRPKQVPVPQ